MADEQAGLKKDQFRDWWLFTKMFNAFRVAIDPTKLLVAAGGVFTMAVGWWLLAAIFFGLWSTPPQWEGDRGFREYYVKPIRERLEAEKDDKKKPEILKELERAEQTAWTIYKTRLNEWNLLYKLAGAPVTLLTSEQQNELKNKNPEAFKAYMERLELLKPGPADLASTLTEYEEIKRKKAEYEKETRKSMAAVTADYDPNAKVEFLKVDQIRIDVESETNEPFENFKKYFSGSTPITASKLVEVYNFEKKILKLEGMPLKVLKQEQWDRFQNYIKGKTLSEIKLAVKEEIKPEVARKAILLLEMDQRREFKPAGYLCTWPWFEDRGSNPFLLVTGQLKTVTTEGVRNVPWARGEFFTWLLNDQAPVLLEPLFKFLAPVVYLFHPAAGTWTWIYLVLVIGWTVATWAFFGGIITRLAAVQVARPNERNTLTDAYRFTCKRYLSYLAAPLLPLGGLAGVAFVLSIFGLLVYWLPWGPGDVLVGGLGFILILGLGFLMALGIIGLVGWPLMYSTISTEGSESFDALSRSYSYVYSAPWLYLWNLAVMILYGAVVIFFVGLVGSLTVYTAKWGMTRFTGEWREPSYLFAWAPTSFGWRDLLLTQGLHTIAVDQISTTGKLEQVLAVNPSYLNDFARGLSYLSFVGTFLVTLWLYLLFLVVVGFGYSYFWSATSIMYLLMRKRVDDNDLDTVHIERARPQVPFTPPVPSSPAKPATPGAVSLTVVETPAPRTAPPPGAVAATPAGTPSATPAEASKPPEPPSPVAAPATPDPPAASEGGASPGKEGEPK